MKQKSIFSQFMIFVGMFLGALFFLAISTALYNSAVSSKHLKARSLTSLTGNNSVETSPYLVNGIVKSCIGYPTNEPLTYVVEVQIGKVQLLRVCISSIPMTNEQPVVIKNIYLYDNMSRNVPIAVPVGNSNLLSQAK